jgi:hypothetical protein
MAATPDAMIPMPVNVAGAQQLPRWVKQHDRKISNSYKLSDINR